MPASAVTISSFLRVVWVKRWNRIWLFSRWISGTSSISAPVWWKASRSRISASSSCRSAGAGGGVMYAARGEGRIGATAVTGGSAKIAGSTSPRATVSSSNSVSSYSASRSSMRCEMACQSDRRTVNSTRSTSSTRSSRRTGLEVTVIWSRP